MLQGQALGLLWMSALCSFMVGPMMVRKQCLWAIALLQSSARGGNGEGMTCEATYDCYLSEVSCERDAEQEKGALSSRETF